MKTRVGSAHFFHDGCFAFAMTLLVVNIELPEGFAPKSNQEFLERLSLQGLTQSVKLLSDYERLI